MRPSLASAALAVVCTLGACAFDDGQPWGVARVSLAAVFDPPPTRLTDGGAVKTDNDYAVTVTALRARFELLELVLASDGGGAFDPANPPAGYSLCHNGHCHADDGRLVDYDVIAAELAGGDEAPRLTIAIGSEVALGTTPTALPLETCGDRGCDVVRTTVRAARLRVVGIAVEGRVEDLRPGQARRLPEGGVPVDVDVALEVTLDETLDVRFGPGEALVAELTGTLAMPASLFDGVAWDDAEARVGEALAAALAANLGEADGVLDVEVTRRDD